MSCKNAMQDGRAFTDYNPNCSINELVQSKYNKHNSTQYRLFLQRNADKVMNTIRQKNEFKNVTGCDCNYEHPPHNEAFNIEAYNYCANDNDYMMRFQSGQDITPFSHPYQRY